MDIKEIVAKNIIELRKKNNLTQTQLAEKVNYSDNAVSRWERGEVTPSLETLQDIANVFGVEIETLIRSDAKQEVQKHNKKDIINKLAIMLILTSCVWLVATIAFACSKFIFGIIFYESFIWAIPASCIVIYPFYKYFGKHIYQFVVISTFVWTFITSLYIQFLNNNLWLLFTIGIPIQVALTIWAFVKPKSIKKVKN